MKCPHCLVEFHADEKIIYLGMDVEGKWGIKKFECPNPKCKKDIYYLLEGDIKEHRQGFYIVDNIRQLRLIRPKASNRPPTPPEVQQEFVKDYYEASLVLDDSPKASAALSRRCLQHILREKAKVKKGNLSSEIQQVLDSGKLPSSLEESIDVIRNVGNFAAHPIKSNSTGEIVPVEPGEAEWNLEVIEMLFDFYFVQPERIKQKRDALNQKLKDAGKPEMKQKENPAK
ncbi:hypothetical protein ES705_14710 [subsurface metagenome]